MVDDRGDRSCHAITLRLEESLPQPELSAEGRFPRSEEGNDNEDEKAGQRDAELWDYHPDESATHAGNVRQSHLYRQPLHRPDAKAAMHPYQLAHSCPTVAFLLR